MANELNLPHSYCIPSWVLQVCLTGTSVVPHGYGGCASQVLHVLYIGGGETAQIEVGKSIALNLLKHSYILDSVRKLF